MTHGKHWLWTLGVALALVGAGATGATDLDAGGPRWVPSTLNLTGDQPAAADTFTPGSVVFHVPTITCPTCPLRVEASIRKAPGILDVAFSGQDVTVTYDPGVVTPEAIEAALEAGGDTAEPVAA